MQITYSELLKDERWKKLSKEVKDRDDNKCVLCDNTKSLQAHHKKYTGLPWEAPICDIITLCSACHEMWHANNNLRNSKDSTPPKKKSNGNRKEPHKQADRLGTTNSAIARLAKCGIVVEKDFYVSGGGLHFVIYGSKMSYFPLSGTYSVSAKRKKTIFVRGGNIESFIAEYKKREQDRGAVKVRRSKKKSKKKATDKSWFEGRKW